MVKYSRDSVPDLSGKVIVVTGGAGGIGLETVYMLARRNATVYMASRNQERSLKVIAGIEERIQSETPPSTGAIHWHELDLSSVATSVSSAEALVKKAPHIDGVIANAGVNLVPYDPKVGDGYETCIQTNHLGHFAFITTLLPTLKTSAEKGDVRIVITSSEAHKMVKEFNYEALDKPQEVETRQGLAVVKDGFVDYAQSKLANLLFMVELDRRVREEGFKNLYANAIDPGMITTTTLAAQGEHNVNPLLSKTVRGVLNVISLTNQEGGLTQTYIASTPDVVEQDIHGQYFKPKLTWTLGWDSPQHVELKPYATDPEMAKKLWAWSEEAVKKALAKEAQRPDAAATGPGPTAYVEPVSATVVAA